MALSKIDSDGIVSGGITADSLNIGQIGGRRNLIINGAMQVAQRGTSVSTSSTGYYTVDRFYIEANGTTPTVTMSQDTASTPDVFTNALKLAVTSTGTPSGFNLAQKIEGYAFSSAGFGGSNAKDLTLSFWVRSSITGTYSIAVMNSNASRSYVAEYTISSADTWEKKTITIDGDTSGAWLTTSGVGLQTFFCLDNDGGSYSTSTIGSWIASNKYAGSTNQVNWAGTSGATFYITGVQLEVGTVATPFEHRSYGEELALCQRYCWRPITAGNQDISIGWYYSNTHMSSIIPFPTTMRASPTMSAGSGYNFYRNGGADGFSTLTLEQANTNNALLLNASEMGGTSGQAGLIRSAASTSVIFSAEL